MTHVVGHLDNTSFFFQAEDGIRDLVRSRGLGDVYKRQHRRRPTGEDQPEREHLPHDVERDREKQEDAIHQRLSLIHI